MYVRKASSQSGVQSLGEAFLKPVLATWGCLWQHKEPEVTCLHSAACGGTDLVCVNTNKGQQVIVLTGKSLSTKSNLGCYQALKLFHILKNAFKDTLRGWISHVQSAESMKTNSRTNALSKWLLEDCVHFFLIYSHLPRPFRQLSNLQIYTKYYWRQRKNKIYSHLLLQQWFRNGRNILRWHPLK